MDILALDLGRFTGYAYNRGAEFFCGTWELATDKEIKAWGLDRQRRIKDPRIERLCETLTDLGKFDIVVFEDVEFASSTYQVQLWSSLRAAVWLCATARYWDCIPVGTLKKFATGSGEATKELMEKRFWMQPEFASIKKVDSDDTVDAAWIWLWAKTNFARIKLP